MQLSLDELAHFLKRAYLAPNLDTIRNKGTTFKMTALGPACVKT